MWLEYVVNPLTWLYKYNFETLYEISNKHKLKDLTSLRSLQKMMIEDMKENGDDELQAVSLHKLRAISL